MDPEFPSNSEASKRMVNKDVQRVTSGTPVRRKKSLRKQFSETFMAGDVKSAVQYGMFEVLLPAARDTIVDVFQGFIEKLFLGDYRRHRGITPPQSGPTGFVSYNRYAMGSRMSSPQRVMSRRARAQHNFDEIVLESRADAELVIDGLYDLVNQYDTATVADLYDLMGLGSTHTDYKWGWTDLQGSGISRVRDGYLLDLPEPHPLD